jgi:hypothetical protein
MKLFSAPTLLLLFCSFLTLTINAQANEQADNLLKQRFSEQHQALIPIVAVADMFFSCNRQRHSDNYDYQIIELVKKMDKNTLAEKLSACLAGEEISSDIALNFGLIGCFHSQMSELNQKKYDEKMAQLELLLVKLPRSERQQTFTKCVTEQAIYYLN